MKTTIFALILGLALLLSASGAQAAGTFVAVDKNAAINTPPNAEQLSSGTTWNAVSIGTLLVNFDAVAYGNGIWCAVSSTSTNSYKSLDGGATWSIGGAVGGGGAVMAYGNGVFAAVRGSPGFGATSTDCATWATNTFTAGANPRSMAFDATHGTFIVMIGNQNVITSTDGATWTQHTGVLTGNGIVVASCGGYTLEVGGGNGGISIDGGTTWYAIYTNAIPWTGIACLDNLHWVVVGGTDLGGGNHVEYTTNAGSTWSNVSTLDALDLAGVAWNGARYVTIANGSTSFGDSSDGQTWASHTGAVSLVAPVLAASLTSPTPPAMTGAGNLTQTGVGQ